MQRGVGRCETVSIVSSLGDWVDVFFFSLLNVPYQSHILTVKIFDFFYTVSICYQYGT